MSAVYVTMVTAGYAATHTIERGCKRVNTSGISVTLDVHTVVACRQRKKKKKRRFGEGKVMYGALSWI